MFCEHKEMIVKENKVVGHTVTMKIERLVCGLCEDLEPQDLLRSHVLLLLLLSF